MCIFFTLVDPYLLQRWIYHYLKKGMQTLMEQGRSTQVISMIKWIRTSRLSTRNSPSDAYLAGAAVIAAAGVLVAGEMRAVAVVPPAAAVRAAARVGICRLQSLGGLQGKA